MPYHSKPKKVIKKKVIKKKPVRKGMTQNQKDKLKEHSKHHSAKHMSIMRKMMKGGTSFSKAHTVAKKMVGK
tara:strand:- start:749 stop:964 length:216 start_codon:yes stop_codon:yes gene_type:complete